MHVFKFKLNFIVLACSIVLLPLSGHAQKPIQIKNKAVEPTYKCSDYPIVKEGQSEGELLYGYDTATGEKRCQCLEPTGAMEGPKENTARDVITKVNLSSRYEAVSQEGSISLNGEATPTKAFSVNGNTQQSYTNSANVYEEHGAVTIFAYTSQPDKYDERKLELSKFGQMILQQSDAQRKNLWHAYCGDAYINSRYHVTKIAISLLKRTQEIRDSAKANYEINGTYKKNDFTITGGIKKTFESHSELKTFDSYLLESTSGLPKNVALPKASTIEELLNFAPTIDSQLASAALNDVNAYEYTVAPYTDVSTVRLSRFFDDSVPAKYQSLKDATDFYVQAIQRWANLQFVHDHPDLFFVPNVDSISKEIMQIKGDIGANINFNAESYFFQMVHSCEESTDRDLSNCNRIKQWIKDHSSYAALTPPPAEIHYLNHSPGFHSYDSGFFSLTDSLPMVAVSGKGILDRGTNVYVYANRARISYLLPTKEDSRKEGLTFGQFHPQVPLFSNVEVGEGRQFEIYISVDTDDPYNGWGASAPKCEEDKQPYSSCLRAIQFKPINELHHQDVINYLQKFSFPTEETKNNSIGGYQGHDQERL